MTEEEVAQVLDLALQRPVAYHKAFAKIAGKACAAVMLSQAWYWTPRAKKLEGWFYKSRKEWTEETGLTRTEQETARRRLVKTGILQEELRGMPATMHFRIDKTRVISLLAENLPTERPKPCKQVGGKPANQSAEKPPTITESTAENDQENTDNKEPCILVFDFYKIHLDHGKTILTDERRKLIARRLREGFSGDDLCAAIRGCKMSAFHQGENDRATVYDSIELIFKDAQHVESFIARANGRIGNGNGHKPTASEKRVDQLRSNFEFLRSGGRSVDS